MPLSHPKINFRSLLLIVFFSCAIVTIEYLYRHNLGISSIRKPFEALFLSGGLITIIIYSRYRLSALFTSLFLFTAYLSQLGHLSIYHSWMSPIEILLFFEQFREVSNTGITLLGKLITPLLISFFIIACSLLAMKMRSKTAKHWSIDIFLLLFILLPIFQAAFSHSKRTDAPHLRYSAVRAAINTQSIFFGITLPYHLTNKSDLANYLAAAPIINKEILPEKNIVLIMGESQNTDNMSVFGYDKPTTPFLAQLKDNSIIKKTYAGGIYTDVSLPTFFNVLEKPNGEAQIYSWKTNLFRLAKQQGYQTYFYTAQSADDMRLTSLLGKQFIDSYSDSTKLGYAPTENAYDDELLPLLDEINLNQGKHFIVLHQRGSHSPYASRSRVNEKPFGNKSLEDEYNNSVYKTDDFIKRVYQALAKHNSDDWTLIYTSDHGQYVKDGAMGHGRLDNPSHYIVPTVITTSKASKLANVRQAFSKCDLIFHHNVSNYLVNLMGYSTVLDNCHDGYINGPRLNGVAGYKYILNTPASQD